MKGGGCTFPEPFPGTQLDKKQGQKVTKDSRIEAQNEAQQLLMDQVFLIEPFPYREFFDAARGKMNSLELKTFQP